MQKPVAALLDGGARLHLQHGPVDLILGAEGNRPAAREQAFAAAARRFETVLPVLAEELPTLRAPLTAETVLRGPVAERMRRAAAPFANATFLTPMIAVAGSVADEVLAVMIAAAPLRRAYVNNGGDIALHLTGDATFSLAMAGDRGADLGRLRLDSASGVGGCATSGAGGRSHSLGVADSVTVAAKDAATADVAATLIANAVDLPEHPGVQRTPAHVLAPDSDLGDRLVVTAVPRLCAADRAEALAAGRRCAERMAAAGQIVGAALFLQGEAEVVGRCFAPSIPQLETENV